MTSPMCRAAQHWKGILPTQELHLRRPLSDRISRAQDGSFHETFKDGYFPLINRKYGEEGRNKKDVEVPRAFEAEERLRWTAQ